MDERAFLSRERILLLFAELDEELARMGIRGDVFIVGGRRGSRPSTMTSTTTG